jgi:hypothetical protein
VNVAGGGATSGSAYVVDPSTLRLDYTDPTLMYTLVQIAITTSAANLVGGGLIGFGLIEWMDVNDTIPTDPPLPVTDGDRDWIYRFVAPVPVNNSGAILTQFFSPGTEKLQESHAKRRLGQTKGILGVFQSFLSPCGSVGPFSIVADLRFLIKE